MQTNPSSLLTYLSQHQPELANAWLALIEDPTVERRTGSAAGHARTLVETRGDFFRTYSPLWQQYVFATAGLVHRPLNYALLSELAWPAETAQVWAMPADAVRLLSAAGHHPATLLLPACLAKQEIENATANSDR